MAKQTTPEEEEFLVAMERKRRRVRRRLLIGGVILLSAMALTVLGLYVEDLRWTLKLRARVRELRATGQIVTVDEIVDRWKSIPEEDNAALVFLKAYEAHDELPTEFLLHRLVWAMAPGVRPSDEALSLLREDVAVNAEALRLVHVGSGLPKSCYPLDPPPDGEFGAILLPHLHKLTAVAALCMESAVLAATSGDGEGAAQAVSDALALARSVGDHPTDVSEFKRVGADGIAVRALQQSLGLCELPAARIDDLSAALAREEGAISMVYPLVTLRSSVQHVIDVWVPNGRWAHLDEQEPPRTYWWWPGVRQNDALHFHSLMDWYTAVAGMTPRRQVRALKAGNDEFGVVFGPDLCNYPVCEDFLFNETASLLAVVEEQTRLTVASTALAVEEWRIEHGRWPDSLQQMVGDTLDAVPLDPYSDTTLIYRKTDTGCIVYSVGPDDGDQGGLAMQEVPKTGRDSDAYDLPFRLLNPELRGAKTATFRDEVLGSNLGLGDLEEAGLDEEALERAGLTDDDLARLRSNQ